jgi:hypothetical protein
LGDAADFLVDLKWGGIMKIQLYVIYAAILGVVSFFTQEIVSYVLLGFILIALNNILSILKEISKKLEQKKTI